jgi:hypothetical protein
MWKPEERDDDVAAFRQGEPHVWVMGRARGKTFGSARKKGEGWTKSPLGGARVVELLENPDYARRMGFVTCLDLFLGNGDRIDAPNLGNWMTDEQNAIALIDNFSSESLQSLTERAQGSWESSFMPDLKPSKFLEKGARVYDQLFSNAPPEVKQAMGKSLGMSPEGRKKLFAKHFAKGMADGRAAILAKLAPMFGKRSRSLKETVVSGEGGQQAWALVKRRVRLFKNLK